MEYLNAWPKIFFTIGSIIFFISICIEYIKETTYKFTKIIMNILIKAFVILMTFFVANIAYEVYTSIVG